MKTLLLPIIILITLNCSAQNTEAARKKHYNLDNNVALSGYDPVSYFANKPIEGNKEINYTYKGVTYYFLTEKSKAVFKANPEKFEPQYGGWCAYALGKKNPELMDADPETYKITNGKLYVFYNSFGVNTKKKWTKNESDMQHNADENWKEIITK